MSYINRPFIKIKIISLFLYFLPQMLFSKISIEQEKKIISFCVERQVKEYIEEKVNSAEILTDPFPHLVINNILPEGLYEIASKYWPDYDHFKGAGARKKIYTTSGCIEATNIIEEKKIFWRTFGEVVVKHYLKPLIIKKFTPYIDWKFPSSSEEELLEIQEKLFFYSYRYDSLVTDNSRYQIHPHIDGIRTFIQAIIYFPPDDLHQELGTVFYKGSAHKRPLCEHKGSAIMEHNGDLVPVKQVDYLPNTLVAFLQSPVSWHGSNPGYQDNNYLRRTYFLDIRLSPEAMQKIYHENPSLLPKYYLHDFNMISPQNW